MAAISMPGFRHERIGLASMFFNLTMAALSEHAELRHGYTRPSWPTRRSTDPVKAPVRGRTARKKSAVASAAQFTLTKVRPDLRDHLWMARANEVLARSCLSGEQSGGTGRGSNLDLPKHTL